MPHRFVKVVLRSACHKMLRNATRH
ncbi:hypothetical protein MPC4_70119 [Methylocella tundrae]|uniref:Uncharacterized protein n=1 Tax=Methylocella tundrae TaxID=227605 RepID=A0A4U8Z4X7_METTU|nr:protein of unknown function [Methylocella tundrae]VTZ27713.1 hypothetical protein MPC1_6380002 [Methylocella tundrae]VTZ52231.1 hypothetical protein MPC4_70119 [Methylocella tundrae]